MSDDLKADVMKVVADNNTNNKNDGVILKEPQTLKHSLDSIFKEPQVLNEGAGVTIETKESDNK